jgi:hypothetical protein
MWQSITARTIVSDVIENQLRRINFTRKFHIISYSNRWRYSRGNLAGTLSDA